MFVGALAAGPLVAICFGFILLVVWARMETRYAAVQQVTGGKVDELVKNDPLAAARFGGWVAAIVGASWHVGDETSTAGFAAATCGGLLVLGWLWLGGMLCPHSQRSANAVPSDTR